MSDEPTQCSTCEASEFGSDGDLVPVWEDPEDYNRGHGPDYIGCTECGTMEEL